MRVEDQKLSVPICTVIIIEVVPDIFLGASPRTLTFWYNQHNHNVVANTFLVIVVYINIFLGE